MNKVQQMAQDLGVKVEDLKFFLQCIKAWMDKGLDFDAAVLKHHAFMNALHADIPALVEVTKQEVVNAFYPG